VTSFVGAVVARFGECRRVPLTFSGLLPAVDGRREEAFAVVSLILRDVPSNSGVPAESWLSRDEVLAIGPRVGIWVLEGSFGVLFADNPSIELVLLPIRGDTGLEESRCGILGGEEGDLAETNDDVLFVWTEVVSLGILTPFSRMGDDGSDRGSWVVFSGFSSRDGTDGDGTDGDRCISLLPCSNLSAKLLI